MKYRGGGGTPPHELPDSCLQLAVAEPDHQLRGAKQNAQ
jgi:hypothetical protein